MSSRVSQSFQRMMLLVAIIYFLVILSHILLLCKKKKLTLSSGVEIELVGGVNEAGSLVLADGVSNAEIKDDYTKTKRGSLSYYLFFFS